MKVQRRIIGIVLFNLVLFLVFSLTASAQRLGQTRLGYSGGDDWEPSIAADRSGHVYVLWPHYGGTPDCAACPSPTAVLQISADRGQTWSAPRVMTPDPLGAYQVDMQIVVDPVDGKTVYAAWLQNNKSDTVVLKSTDYGQTWTAPVVADSTNAGTDKPILAVRGRDVYVAFDHQQKLYVATSHDGGATFTPLPVRQSNNFGLSLAGGGAIDSRGNVYFAWAGYSRSGNAQGPVSLYISKSMDGGQTWTGTLLDTSAAPPDCSAYRCEGAFLGAQIVVTVDANDTLYALWNAGTVDRGPEQMYFARSTDGGATWTPRLDVSLAPAGTGHAFPVIVSGGAGNVRIAWMDNRNNSMWNVNYRTSADGGVTWSGETLLSSYVQGYPYLSATGFAFPYGDYFEMGVDDRGNTHAVWGEGPNWTGPGNIWYTHLTP
ncbi:MAG: sialidase family protein [Anaerolineae bacterium]